MEEKLTIAKNIKLMREASNYTQENIASFLGIRRSAYSNYESGERELPLAYMEKLADLYGCDAYLLYEENEKDYNKWISSCTKSIDYSLYDPCEKAGYPMEKRYELECYIEFDE